MKAHYLHELSITALRTLHLCAATDEKTPLFTVAVQSGTRWHGPLADPPGLNLYNVPSRKDAILAAAGDESSVTRYLAFDARSVVLIPPLRPKGDATAYHLVEETMHHITVQGDSGVAFRWAIEVGRGRKREKFEWRKVSGGFKLLRLEARAGVNGEGGSIQPESSQECKVVALLTWPTGLEWIKKAFTLELKGSGLAGFLGDRWTLMVIVTAARIWALSRSGKTTKAFVAFAETVHAK